MSTGENFLLPCSDFAQDKENLGPEIAEEHCVGRFLQNFHYL